MAGKGLACCVENSVDPDKVGKMPASKHICHASGIYQEIMENTGQYDLQPSTFRLVISIIEVI